MNTGSAQNPQIDFYLLSDPNDELFNYTCRLTEKAFLSGFTIFIWTQNRDDAKTIDRMLWSFRADSFIPHRIITSDINDSLTAKNQSEPVIISDELPAACHCTLMINLTDKAITQNNTFKRICHIVSGNTEKRAIARQTFRAYKKLNIQPNTIRV